MPMLPEPSETSVHRTALETTPAPPQWRAPLFTPAVGPERAGTIVAMFPRSADGRSPRARTRARPHWSKSASITSAFSSGSRLHVEYTSLPPRRTNRAARRQHAPLHFRQLRKLLGLEPPLRIDPVSDHAVFEHGTSMNTPSYCGAARAHRGAPARAARRSPAARSPSQVRPHANGRCSPRNVSSARPRGRRPRSAPAPSGPRAAASCRRARRTIPASSRPQPVAPASGRGA